MPVARIITTRRLSTCLVFINESLRKSFALTRRRQEFGSKNFELCLWWCEWERLTEGVQYVVQDLQILDQSAVHRTWVRVLYLSSDSCVPRNPFPNTQRPDPCLQALHRSMRCSQSVRTVVEKTVLIGLFVP